METIILRTLQICTSPLLLSGWARKKWIKTYQNNLCPSGDSDDKKGQPCNHSRSSEDRFIYVTVRPYDCYCYSYHFLYNVIHIYIYILRYGVYYSLLLWLLSFYIVYLPSLWQLFGSRAAFLAAVLCRIFEAAPVGILRFFPGFPLGVAFLSVTVGAFDMGGFWSCLCLGSCMLYIDESADMWRFLICRAICAVWRCLSWERAEFLN